MVAMVVLLRAVVPAPSAIVVRSRRHRPLPSPSPLSLDLRPSGRTVAVIGSPLHSAGMQVLSPEQLRVLGALIEKEATTPDQYPITLNALVLACNQTSNRNPIVD